MICAKCKKECDRRSNSQKYCESCSPDKHRFKKEYTPIKKPVKKERPEILCNTCGKFVKYATWNQKHRTGYYCQKHKASMQKDRNLKRKKYLKKYGAYLVSQIGNKDETPWENLRYVTDEEIKEMQRRTWEILTDNQKQRYKQENLAIEVINFHSNRFCWFVIEQPGYYRVEPMPELNEQYPWRYHSSNPTNNLSLSHFINKFQRYYSQKRHQGENVWIKKQYQKRMAEQRRSYHMRTLKINDAVRQFSSTMMMAGEIRKGIRQ